MVTLSRPGRQRDLTFARGQSVAGVAVCAELSDDLEIR